MIKFENLSIGYGGKVIQSGLSAELKGGELTCLLGLNGTGKSTLLRTLCGFQRALSVDVALLEKPLHEWTPQELSTKVGVVLTEKGHAGGLTVRELVSLGRQPHTGFFGRLDVGDFEVVNRAMEAAGIAGKADSFISSLSDGERQRAFIAKALAQECPVIILDEPTAFLDVVGRVEIMELLETLAHKEGKAVLVSTHDMEQAVRSADTLWILDRNGGLVCGAPETLRNCITNLLYQGSRR